MERNRINRLVYSSREQGGFLIWGLCLLLLLLWRYYAPKPEVPELEINQPEVIAWLCVVEAREDSIRLSKSVIRAFNPNFINGSKANKLGLSPSEFERLEQYRSRGQWVNSTEDFQRVTGVSASWMGQYAQLFKFPDFILAKNNTTRSSARTPKKTDLNKANLAALQNIQGIGPVLSQRILSWRDKYGAFRRWEELGLVYGINDALVAKLQAQFDLDTTLALKRQNINGLAVSDIAALPLISFDLARTIWEFVRLRQWIDTLEELNKIDKITPQVFGAIQLYLFAMKTTP